MLIVPICTHTNCGLKAGRGLEDHCHLWGHRLRQDSSLLGCKNVDIVKLWFLSVHSTTHQLKYLPCKSLQILASLSCASSLWPQVLSSWTTFASLYFQVCKPTWTPQCTSHITDQICTNTNGRPKPCRVNLAQTRQRGVTLSGKALRFVLPFVNASAGARSGESHLLLRRTAWRRCSLAVGDCCPGVD